MATPLGHVLIVGNDQADMEIRRAVLDHFWPIRMITLATWQPEKLTDDVIVLCSSIPKPVQQSWIDRVRQHSPNILLVRMNGFDSGPHAGADATVDEHHGPGALVSTIYELLMERGLGSRGWPIAGELPRLH